VLSALARRAGTGRAGGARGGGQGRTEKNKREEAFLRSLRRAIPRSRPVVIVADRGFGRTTLFEFLLTLGFPYVIRVTGKVWIQCPGYEGNLCDYPLSVGHTFTLTPVLYH